MYVWTCVCGGGGTGLCHALPRPPTLLHTLAHNTTPMPACLPACLPAMQQAEPPAQPGDLQRRNHRWVRHRRRPRRSSACIGRAGRVPALACTPAHLHCPHPTPTPSPSTHTRRRGRRRACRLHRPAPPVAGAQCAHHVRLPGAPAAPEAAHRAQPLTGERVCVCVCFVCVCEPAHCAQPLTGERVGVACGCVLWVWLRGWSSQGGPGPSGATPPLPPPPRPLSAQVRTFPSACSPPPLPPLPPPPSPPRGHMCTRAHAGFYGRPTRCCCCLYPPPLARPVHALLLLLLLRARLCHMLCFSLPHPSPAGAMPLFLALVFPSTPSSQPPPHTLLTHRTPTTRRAPAPPAPAPLAPPSLCSWEGGSQGQP